MLGHNLSVNVNLSVYDKDGKLVRNIQPPKEVSVSEDHIDFLLKEANGVLIKKETIPFKSFNRNFMGLLDYGFGNRLTVSVTMSDATKYNCGLGTMLESNAPVSNSLYGILVGTSSAPQSWLDYKLGGLCSTGKATNQLQYGITTGLNYVTSGSVKYFCSSRTFKNDWTASISIKEVGYMTKQTVINKYMLISRDLVNFDDTPLDITIDPGQVLEVVYSMGFDMNDGWVDNWYLLLSGSCRLTTQNYTKVCGISVPSNHSATTQDYFYHINYNAGVFPTGIAVGSSDTPVSMSDYNLRNIIFHGTGSGQLIYGDTIYLTSSVSIQSQSMTSNVIRKFTNNSGDSIIVNEVAVICSGRISADAPSDPNNTLLIRKVITPVTVKDKESLNVGFAFYVSSSIT
ncbi:MAG: hypothetical protein WC346_08645 [Methanogenium sp.]|jgi:hypothetical protein